MKLKINDEDIDENGRIKQRILEKNFEDVTEVYCCFCKTLTELPMWPNLKTISCGFCPLLQQLPLWPKVEKVNCCKCETLSELPLWSNIIEIICTSNKFVKLPLWITVEYVCCSYCPLRKLPLWPNVKEIWCFNCSLLKLPMRSTSKFTRYHRSTTKSIKSSGIYFACEQEKINEMIQKTKNMILLSKKLYINPDIRTIIGEF